MPSASQPCGLRLLHARSHTVVRFNSAASAGGNSLSLDPLSFRVLLRPPGPRRDRSAVAFAFLGVSGADGAAAVSPAARERTSGRRGPGGRSPGSFYIPENVCGFHQCRFWTSRALPLPMCEGGSLNDILTVRRSPTPRSPRFREDVPVCPCPRVCALADL